VLDFEQIFREHNSLIFRYLMKLCGNVSLAEELTQETFFRAYMNLAALREKEKVSAWLYQIAKNTYFAWCNEQKRYKPDMGMEIGSRTVDVIAHFEEKDLAERAFACVNRLDRVYREVFMLHTFGEQSLKEISAIYGKSESWARVTFYRAKQKIMEELGETDEL